MVYTSQLIDDFAFLLMYIEEIEKRYAVWGIAVEHKIIPIGHSFKVVFKPYEVR